MPFIFVKMLEGRTDEVKSQLVEKVTETVAETLSIETDGVFVIIEDIPGKNLGVGGKVQTPR